MLHRIIRRYQICPANIEETTYMKAFPQFALLAAILFVLGAPVFADDLPLPLQAILSVKVMEQDAKLTPAGGVVKIGIVGADAKSLAAQFDSLQAKGVTVKGASLSASALAAGWEASASDYNVIYILSGSAVAGAIKATRGAQVLSICGADGEASAAKGVAVGLALSDGKPKIFLNITAAMKEGQEFSAQMLTLATVVK